MNVPKAWKYDCKLNCRWANIRLSYSLLWAFFFLWWGYLFQMYWTQVQLKSRQALRQPPPSLLQPSLLKWSWTVPVHIARWNRLLLFSSLSQKARHFAGVPIPLLHSDKAAIILWTFLFTEPGGEEEWKRRRRRTEKDFFPEVSLASPLCGGLFCEQWRGP